MPWTAPIVGYSDSLGYQRCVEHAADTNKQFPIHGDEHFFDDDRCDVCGRKFPHISTADYVHISHGAAIPEIRVPA